MSSNAQPRTRTNVPQHTKPLLNNNVAFPTSSNVPPLTRKSVQVDILLGIEKVMEVVTGMEAIGAKEALVDIEEVGLIEVFKTI